MLLQLQCVVESPGDLVKDKFWFSRFGVGHDILHFYQVPKWCHCCHWCKGRQQPSYLSTEENDTAYSLGKHQEWAFPCNSCEVIKWLFRFMWIFSEWMTLQYFCPSVQITLRQLAGVYSLFTMCEWLCWGSYLEEVGLELNPEKWIKFSWAGGKNNMNV